jgi:hypothetical protein
VSKIYITELNQYLTEPKFLLTELVRKFCETNITFIVSHGWNETKPFAFGREKVWQTNTIHNHINQLSLKKTDSTYYFLSFFQISIIFVLNFKFPSQAHFLSNLTFSFFLSLSSFHSLIFFSCYFFLQLLSSYFIFIIWILSSNILLVLFYLFQMKKWTSLKITGKLCF